MESSIQTSIVVPLYNEAENIDQLYRQLAAIAGELPQPVEFVFSDDGSRDTSFSLVKKLHAADNRVKGISLSRNFGHQVALAAGLSQASGEIIITMDADLQHPPDVIPRLIEEYRKGFDIVNTRRIDVSDIGPFKKISSKYFYRLINTFSDVKIIESSSDFRLMNRKALNAFLQFVERDRFTRGLVSWMGFSQSLVPYECPPRFAGKSKYTLKKMFRFATDGITSFSAKPLRIASYTGVIVFLAGLLYSGFAVIKYMAGKTIQGWTSLLITILLLGGIQLLTLGIIGEYLARIFNESKARPLYFIKDRIA